MPADKHRPDIDGYVGDSNYPSLFHDSFSPPVVDAMLLHSRISPPRSDRSDFVMADIGCGDGLGLILLAAVYPKARFVGIDAMPEHINRGRKIITELGLDNIELRNETFAEALKSEPIEADYVAVQGVWSWVSPENQNAMLSLVTSSLKPHGIATLGYNTLPGWTPIMAFQKIIRTLADGQDGSPTQRFDGALEQLRTASKAGMEAVGEGHLEWLDTLKEGLPADYFAHEYLNGHWQPLWSGDAIAAAWDHGLHFVRTCRSDRLRPDFALKKAQREQLEKIKDQNAREIMEDMFLNCWFRVDMFSKGTPKTISDETARSARLDGYWRATGSSATAEFSTKTAAGTLRFDNKSARAILERLDHGPATLREIHEQGEAGTAADILNVADVLFIANRIEPVDYLQSAAKTKEINAWLSDREKKGSMINAIVAPHGPISVPRGEIAISLENQDFQLRSGLKQRAD